MKLSCLQENLSRGLSIVGRAVATKTTLPITNNILLSTEQSRLKLAATNLEIGINCWIGAKVEEEGAITVPARLLAEFVNSMPNERIDLALSARTRTLLIRCARFDARMKGLDAEDFPPIPSAGDQPTTRIEPDLLREAITQVAFAAATDETRPVLTGVYCRLAGDELTLAAADGFRLAVRTVALAVPVVDPVEVIVPARTLAELNRVLGDQTEPVEVTVTPNKSQILFHLSNVDMVSQLIQGTFPNFRQLIPQSFASRAVVSRSDFLHATRAASIFARDSNGIIRLQVEPGEELTPGRMLVSARAEELGDNLGEVDCLVDGEAAKIAFNAKYLAEVLGVISSNQVALQTNSPSSPGVVRPVGMDEYTHVIMPMFVDPSSFPSRTSD